MAPGATRHSSQPEVLDPCPGLPLRELQICPHQAISSRRAQYSQDGQCDQTEPVPVLLSHSWIARFARAQVQVRGGLGLSLLCYTVRGPRPTEHSVHVLWAADLSCQVVDSHPPRAGAVRAPPTHRCVWRSGATSSLQEPEHCTYRCRGWSVV